MRYRLRAQILPRREQVLHHAAEAAAPGSLVVGVVLRFLNARPGVSGWSRAGSAGVSGNGTRFVWYGEGAEERQVVERALVNEVEAGFVAVHEGERG